MFGGLRGRIDPLTTKIATRKKDTKVDDFYRPVEHHSILRIEKNAHSGLFEFFIAADSKGALHGRLRVKHRFHTILDSYKI